ncbi:MAG TPA: GspH/FimT family pseudopilin [Burkholderiaceae bacterium]|nr:GspH/FimT family pseudopilin [Burkholderiaceae bacterium]HMY98724.1 GspH/FimT family pseudopilin [Burkholderiaceae bacterium]HNB44850.1 GspH/FimT family pseudopilin [Burkholderiaceae bacterium]HNG78399.1 GspH/FimT family pseudopilin [Burkholderiaceae bacterium]
MLRPPRVAGAPARVHGLTIIELLVTVTVLGLLLLAIMPSVTEWLRSTEVRNAAESIVAGLQKTRAEAVRRNQPVLFSLVSTVPEQPGQLGSDCALSATSASWVVSLVSPEGKCDVAPSETTAPQIIEKHAQGDGARSAVIATFLDKTCKTTTTTTQVKFDSFGRPSGEATALRCFKVTHASGSATTIQIELDAGGGVRSCLPELKVANDPRLCTTP